MSGSSFLDSCFDLPNRLSHTSNHPPFSNGFRKWSDAVDYYAVNYHNNNVKIITAPGSTYDPIAITSDAPTPVKNPQVIRGLGCKTVRRDAPDTSAKAGSSKKLKTSNGATASASTTTRASAVKGKKRARPATPTPTSKEQKTLAYLGKVINVSDFKDSDDESK